VARETSVVDVVDRFVDSKNWRTAIVGNSVLNHVGSGKSSSRAETAFIGEKVLSFSWVEKSKHSSMRGTRYVCWHYRMNGRYIRIVYLVI